MLSTIENAPSGSFWIDVSITSIESDVGLVRVSVVTCRPTPTIVGEKSRPTGTKVASSIGPEGWKVTVVDPTGRLDPPLGKDGRHGGDVVGVTGRRGTVVVATVVDGSGAVVVGGVVGAAVVGGSVVGGGTSTTVRANTWVPAGTGGSPTRAAPAVLSNTATAPLADSTGPDTDGPVGVVPSAAVDNDTSVTVANGGLPWSA